jgi:hypothetical protein
VLEFLILCDCLFCDGMDNTETVVGNIGGWKYPGRCGTVRGGVEGHEMVNGLQRIVTRVSC